MKQCLVALAVLLGAGTCAAAASADIHVVALGGIIHPVSSSYLIDAIERADSAGAAALVIEIDTPGGLVGDTKDIIKRMLAAKTPVVCFVTPYGSRAASGGFFILLAADIAAMSPGTNTGAAHPIQIGGENTKDNIEMQKAESDLAAYARSLAENRGRNVKLAETAVTQSVSWTEKEALDGKLIELIALDLPDLLKKLDGRRIRRFGGEETTLDLKGTVTRSRAMSSLEKVQSFLLTPEIAAFLLLIGLLGIYVEITHPGVVLPGVVGVIALMLFAYAAHILPVSVFGLLLIGLAIGLFILEIKIVSHGLLGIGGVISLVVGSLILFNGPIPELRLPALVILPTSLVISAIMLLIVRFVVRAQKGRIATGTEGMVGEIGTAATDLSPEGTIFVHGEYWNARAAGATGAILRGARVRIRAVEDMRLLVEPEGRGA